MKTILFKYFFVSSIVVPVDICSYHQHIFKIEVIKVGFLRCVESLKISQGIGRRRKSKDRQYNVLKKRDK